MAETSKHDCEVYTNGKLESLKSFLTEIDRKVGCLGVEVFVCFLTLVDKDICQYIWMY